MRVVHMTSVHSAMDTRIFLKECTALVNEGYDVHLVAPNAKCKESKGVSLHCIENSSKSRFMRMTKTMWNIYKKAVSLHADIYHFHDPELIIVGLILKLRGKKKVVYDVHEDVPKDILSKQWIPKGARKIVSTLFKAFESFASNRMDAVVCATPFICNNFSQSRSVVVNVNNYPIINELAYEGINWSDKEKAACYIGGISLDRGIKEVVQAISKTDVELYLAGNYDYGSTKKVASDLPGWDKVHEFGFVGREEIAKILSKSMVGLVVLHPLENYVDSLPIKMFEYMSAGIPVIASKFPLWEGIIKESKCGVCVDPFDVDGIANAIQYYVNNPLEAKEAGENGRKAVEEKYNWDIEKKKLIELYSKLLK